MSKSLLKTVNLSKEYRVKGTRRVRALHDINVDLDRDCVVALLGKNGSGKSTFVKSCCNLITYDGNIFYEGHRLRRGGNSLNRYYAAVLEGNRNIYWKLTVLENIRYFAALRLRRDRDIMPLADQMLRMLYLYDKRDVLVERLSRGMQQKTALICTMVLNTPVLFLDEPTLGLDVESKGQMIEFFNRRELFEGRLACITSHDLEFVRKVVDEVIIIKDGRLQNRYKTENLVERTTLVEVVVRGHQVDFTVSNISLEVVKISRTGEYTAVVVEAGPAPLSEVTVGFERVGLDVVHVKRLSFDLETIYMVAQQEGSA